MNYGTINAPASSSSVKIAREAFEKGDPSASRLLHQGKMLFPNSGQALERHSKQGGKFLKSVIYGGYVFTVFFFDVLPKKRKKINKRDCSLL